MYVFFQANSDEMALQAKAQENLPFIAADLSKEVKDKLTFRTSELIRNCAFDMKSCDIQRLVLLSAQICD